MNIDESILSKLTDEQKKKAQSAQSPEEILAIAKEARSPAVNGNPAGKIVLHTLDALIMKYNKITPSHSQ